MPSLFLTTPGTRVSLASERLHVEFPAANDHDQPAPARDIPLHDIEQIVADGRTHLTTPALCECLRRSIPVVFLACNQSVLGLCQAPAGAARIRVIQHRRASDSALGLALAAAVVEAKIQNSRRVLQRLAANRADCDLARPLADLEYLRRSCLDGRRRFLTGYERRLEREFTSEQHGSRTSLRGELCRQVQYLKHTLTSNAAFGPFPMN